MMYSDVDNILGVCVKTLEWRFFCDLATPKYYGLIILDLLYQ